MKKVYLVYATSDDNSYIIGVFTKKKKAKEVAIRKTSYWTSTQIEKWELNVVDKEPKWIDF